MDPTGNPHVGGNTWQGGSGGADTAGLGGKGGPYRMDSGNPVHQMNEANKADISAEVKTAAREMVLSRSLIHVLFIFLVHLLLVDHRIAVL